jgi:hypothetical protein
VGFVGEGSVVADRGVGSVTGEWWVSSKIWLWKLGVGEEASLPVRGDLARDRGWVGLGVGSWRQGYRLQFFLSPVHEYQLKRMKLFYIVSFFCLFN